VSKFVLIISGWIRAFTACVIGGVTGRHDHAHSMRWMMMRARRRALLAQRSIRRCLTSRVAR
jgi:hypothetical protein